MVMMVAEMPYTAAEKVLMSMSEWNREIKVVRRGIGCMMRGMRDYAPNGTAVRTISSV